MSDKDKAPKGTADVPPINRGGRPSREEAEQIRERILDAATELFLTLGYGATSIEAVTQRVRMSKRTFYHRFRDKADLFEAVVRRIVGQLRPADISQLFDNGTLEEILLRLAKLALRAAISPQATALHRLIVAEAPRFPELAAIALGEGSRQAGIDGITVLLMRETPTFPQRAARFAAEQFLQMVVSLPQRRTLGLGTPMTVDDCDRWAQETVDLFLQGGRNWKPGA
jgi:AcrR family transcriptional regulator